MDQRMPAYFLSHGGGPWPWLKKDRPGIYDQLEGSLHNVRRELGEAPRAVLMLSGHWETDRFLVSPSAKPPMAYDYSGFPEHTYQIRYDAPGDPALAGGSATCSHRAAPPPVSIRSAASTMVRSR